MQNVQAVNMPDYGALFTIEIFVHNTLIIIFLWYTISYRILEIFFHKSIDSSRVPYIPFWDSTYMIFFYHYVYIQSLCIMMGQSPQ